MAVEAHNLNLFPPQLLGIRQMMNPIEASSNLYNAQMGFGVPLSTRTESALFQPMYNSSVITDSIPQKQTVIKSDNVNNLSPSSRKLTRDSMINYNPCNNSSLPKTTPFSFLGHDISVQIQQQQFDIDHLISQHMEKVRIEIEQRRKKLAIKIMESIEESIMNKLRSKEAEIERIGKMNWQLEERVKSQFIENQIWRDLAQSNEAAVNALRSNLEQILTSQLKDDHHHHHQNGIGLGDQIEDEQSSCGEVDGKLNEQLGNSVRLCRNCNKEESCVLFLPCRHLCLCTVCGSSVHTCPICNSEKSASVHVNMS